MAFGAVAAVVDAFDNGGHAHGLFDTRHIFGIVHGGDLEQHPVGKGAQEFTPFLRGQLFLCCTVIQSHRYRMHRELKAGINLGLSWLKAERVNNLVLPIYRILYTEYYIRYGFIKRLPMGSGE